MAGYTGGRTARKLSDAEKDELVKEVRDNIEDCYNHERKNRQEAETDLDFLAGNQWPDFVKTAREGKRPMITVNQLPAFVRQVTNPTREADIAIKVLPEDGSADTQTAKTFSDLIRQIEYLSSAKQVYCFGHENQTGCGIGWWQVCMKYVDDAADFDQEIRLQRVDFPFAVYCDPGAVLPAREDAMWIAVIENWPRKKFEAKWPKASKVDVDAPDLGPKHGVGIVWSSKDTVAVAMYYKKVPETKTLALTMSGKTIEITGKPMMELEALHAEDPIVTVRDCHTHRVEKYIMSGQEVLEGPVAWPGKYIPIIPVVGAELPTKDGMLRYGVVRFMRDPQQLLNFYRTAAVETIAMAPKAPYKLTTKQLGPHKQMWDGITTENRPYILYEPDDRPGVQPPQREAPPETPVAAMQQAEVAVEDMRRVSNIYQAAVGAASNETSGLAIQQRAGQSDMANAHFSDNLTYSIGHTGRVLIDLVPKVYDNERVMRLRDQNGDEYTTAINQVVMNDDGMPVLNNDLSAGRYDVRVTVGKNFLTKRVEALSMMLEFAKTLPPEAQMLFLDLIAKNSDWPGAEELAKRFRNMVPKEALHDPDDPNSQPPEPDPMMIANLEKLAKEIEEIAAKAANIAKDTELKEAQRIKTLTEADQVDSVTDHQIIIPSITGSVPSVPAGKPNGAAGAPMLH